LLLGPFLILGIILGSWFDQWLDAQEAFAWFTNLTGRLTWPPGMVVWPVVSALAVLGAIELKRIYDAAGMAVSRRVVVTLVLVSLAMVAFIPKGLDGVAGAALVNSVFTVILVGTLMFHSRHKQVDGAIMQAGGALLAMVYLGIMFGFLLLIRRENSAWILLWVLVTTKASDIGAYFVGRAIGKHKLIPWLSPGKTWEGLFGGMVFSGLVGGGLAVLMRESSVPAPGFVIAALMGVAFAVVGTAGDLVMSLLKRDAGVKDAGKSLPGFGGVLDVLDSVLLVAPVAFWLLRLAVQATPDALNLLE